MPGSEVVAVVALVPLTRGIPEVVEVPLGPGRPVLVVADRWFGAVLAPAPRGLVALLELLKGFDS